MKSVPRELIMGGEQGVLDINEHGMDEVLSFQ